MADISKITLPNNEEYNLKDKEARDKLSNLPNFSVNPNILINSYFVGGGSHTGEGNLPINQNGEDSYNIENNESLSIDRWISGNTGISISFEEDDLVLSPYSNAAYGVIKQKIPFKKLAGKTITYSILYKNQSTIGLATGSGTVPLTNTNGQVIINLTSQIQNGSYCRVDFEANKDIYCKIGVSSSLKIIAAKLELGDTQTLAHLENNIWVLNEIPDYWEELKKCQRYYKVIENLLTYNVAVNLGTVIAYSATQAILNLDMEFIDTPTMQATDLKLANTGYNNGITATISSIGYKNGRLQLYLTASGLTAGTSYRVLAKAGTKIIFSV